MKKLSEITSPITPQKVANAMDAPVAMNESGVWFAHNETPWQCYSSWESDRRETPLNWLDIQWEGDWQDSLHEPEPEILPGLDGTMPVSIWDHHTGYRIEKGSGKHSIRVGSFDTRVKAIRAWNAVVRSLRDD